MSTNKTVAFGVVVGVIFGFLIGALAYSGGLPGFGANRVTGEIHRQIEQFTMGLKIGTNSVAINELSMGVCSFTNMDASHAATTTKPYDCAFTGVASGDAVFVLPSLTVANAGATNAFWAFRSCHASTTAGYITCEVFNGTGGAAVPSATGVGSSTNVLYGDY